MKGEAPVIDWEDIWDRFFYIKELLETFVKKITLASISYITEEKL